MDIEEIPCKIRKTYCYINSNLYTIDNIKKIKELFLYSKTNEVKKFNKNMQKYLIDSKYIMFSNLNDCQNISNYTHYYEGNNTIQIYKYESKYYNIINQNHIISLKIYFNNYIYDNNSKLKLINNLPPNIENIYLLDFDCIKKNIYNLNNLPITLKKIYIYIYDRNRIKLQEIINIKIPFGCSLNCIFYGDNRFSKVYKDLQKYK